MFLAHSFRLRRPWDCESEGEQVRWSRVFHQPTGLEKSDRLWLVVSGLPAEACVSLNEQTLTSPSTEQRGQFDVTELLADANRIEILTSRSEGEDEKFPFDVRLGIVGHE